MANTNFRVKNGLTVDGAASIGGNATITGKLTQSNDYGYLGIYNSASPSVTYPTQNQTLAIANNFSGGSAEVNIWNTMNPTTYTGTGIRFQQQLTTSTYRDLLFLKNDGNVGVGTTTPGYKLQVVNGYIYQSQTDATMARIGLSNSNREWTISNYGTSFSPNGGFVIADETAPAVRLVINTSGHVLPGNNNTQNLGSASGLWSNVYSTNLYGTLQTASQPNITSVGTLSSLSVTGGNYLISTSTNFSAPGTLDASAMLSWSNSVNNANWSFSGVDNRVFSIILDPNNRVCLRTAGNLDIIGNLLPYAANTYNLGSSIFKWATMYGVASQATYADLAEKYTADDNYEPGTVLDFGGVNEVTISNTDMSQKIAGIVSTNPGYLMNAELESEFAIDLALTGRVPCKVVGKVSKGDLLVVSIIPGVAQASEDPKAGSIIGKALANYDNDRIGIIEVLVGKH